MLSIKQKTKYYQKEPFITTLTKNKICSNKIGNKNYKKKKKKKPKNQITKKKK